METSLLTTKLNIPPSRPQITARPRLIERLYEGLNYNLTLVSAPAGFGKTTLVSEWVRQNRTPTTWISLDEGDNDPVRFWNYFIAAIQRIQPECGNKIMPLLQSTQSSAEPMLNALINELSGVTGIFTVVLDDFHLVESRQIHDGITYLLEHLPERIHLVIASRADPPLPLARFRGKEMMLEIRTNDLRFNADEVAKLFEELTLPRLAAGDITALNERTEGWVVGLKMAALSMKEQKDIPGFIADFTGSQRYVMDYLMEEVLQKQTPDICEFLRKTSILKRLNAPLCNAVTRREGSQSILLELERSHLFIIPLDESREWYRYEHLFSDLLLHQCQATYGAEQVFDFHKRASKWYEDNKLPDDAIHHSLAAKDWDTAVKLIYPCSEELRNQAQWKTPLGWLKKIPQEFLRDHHRLYCQYAGFLSAVGEYNAAEAALSYLENAARDDADLQADAAFLLSSMAWQRLDIERVITLNKRALSLLPLDNLAMRARAFFGLGFAQYAQFDFLKAEQLMTESYELAYKGGDIWLASATLALLGNIRSNRGDFNGALELYKKTIEIAGQTQGASGGQTGLCRFLYERNDLEAAAENARLAAQWVELGGNPHNAILANFIGIQVCLALGDLAGAAAAMEKMDRAGRHPALNPFYHASHAAFHLMYAIRQNHMKVAEEWGKKLSEYSASLFIEYHHMPARLLIAQGKKEEATQLLSDLYKRMAQTGLYGLMTEVHIFQALAADNEETALEFLSDALINGEPEGFIRSFVDEGELLKPLLEKALSKGITPEYTRKLLTIIEAEERQKRKMKKGEGAPSPYQDLLSERELEVLRLMAEGLSNQQIADRLIISLGTAKNHAHSILEKLNAKGRTQAVARARELGII